MSWKKENIRNTLRQWQHDYYWKHHEKRLNQIRQAYAKRIALIFNELGHRCLVCGVTEPLVIHHLGYKDTPTRSLKALRAGKLILLCRKHHRAVHFINEVKRAGYLDNILKLLNNEQHPYLKKRNLL